MVHIGLCLVLLACSMDVFGSTYEDVEAIQTRVLTGYKTNIRPLNNQSDVMNVNMTGILYQIINVDAVRSTVTVVASFMCHWYDERITWVPADYNNTQSIMIYKSNVWIPHLTLGNPMEMDVFDQNFMHVAYTYQGMASFHAGNILEMTCDFDLKYWPFDEQECEMYIYAYDQSIERLRFTELQVNADGIGENPEWTLEKFEPNTWELFGKSFAGFKIKLKRQSTYYVLQIILPLIGMGILSQFVFLLPSESGERVSFATTILLALTVFLTIIGDNVPKTSNPIPIIIAILSAGVIMSLLSTFTVIVGLYIYHRDTEKDPVTTFWRKFVYVTKRIDCSRKKTNKVDEISILPDKLSNEKKSTSESTNIYSNGKKTISDDLTKNANTKGILNDSGEEEILWQDVSNAIDKVAFIVATLFNMVAISMIVSLMLFNS